MCGIWGIVGKRTLNDNAIRGIVEDLFRYSESRGKEAAGIAALTNKGIISLKHGEPASKLIKKRVFYRFMEKALSNDVKNITMIGHSRLATNGSENNNNNNQPVVVNQTALVHNGIIVNVDTLWEDNCDIKRQSDLDTEVLGKLISKKKEKVDGISAIKNAFKQIQGTASTLIIDSMDMRLNAVTNNGSLYYLRSKDGNWVVFASEAYILKEVIDNNSIAKNLFEGKRIWQLETNKGISVCVDTLKAKRFQLDKYVVQHGVTKKTLANNCLKKYYGLDIDIDAVRRLKRCTKCVLPETFPYIEFDSEGVCNYCRSYKKMKYVGKSKLEQWTERTKRKYGKKQYNAIVSFSGGRDSSYGLHYFVKELGLKPVAYNYDWGMVTDLARRNQARMCGALGVELITVSANIHKKRENIRKNVSAWLKRPDLGMVPLFMAGDKAYFYYANVMKKRFGLDSVLLASNPFEATLFKTGFCGIKPSILKSVDNEIDVERLYPADVVKMVGYYTNQYMKNGGYFNRSLTDTAVAAMSYYVIPHDYFRLFDYIPWDEDIVNDVLINEYDWELSPDTDSTWRIGDGTAPFYNYIYYSVCGFTENDTLRSNQIREGCLEREKALELVYKDNQPRWESLEWYFNVLGLDMVDALRTVKRIKKVY